MKCKSIESQEWLTWKLTELAKHWVPASGIVTSLLKQTPWLKCLSRRQWKRYSLPHFPFAFISTVRLIRGTCSQATRSLMTHPPGDKRARRLRNPCLTAPEMLWFYFWNYWWGFRWNRKESASCCLNPQMRLWTLKNPTPLRDKRISGTTQRLLERCTLSA